METISRFIDYDCSTWSVSLNQHFIQQIRPTPWLNWDLSGGMLWASEGLFYHFLGYIKVTKYQFIYSFLIFQMTQLERTLLCLYFPAWIDSEMNRPKSNGNILYEVQTCRSLCKPHSLKGISESEVVSSFSSPGEISNRTSALKNESIDQALIYPLRKPVNDYINEFSELIEERSSGKLSTGIRFFTLSCWILNAP